MRSTTHSAARALAALTLLSAWSEITIRCPAGQVELLFKPRPFVLHVANFEPGLDSATISDVQLADFDGDGRLDIAAAWYATDLQDAQRNARKLTIFFNRGGRFERGGDLDLYVPDPSCDALSVFRNGTGSLAVGDFDGDGRPDLAVFPFFGDELWLVENLGGGDFQLHLKFPFGYNSPGNFLTPPRAFGVDLNRDGRDELIYVADPVQQIDADIIHIWSTDGAIASMARVDWAPLSPSVYTQWTRGLAITDVDHDGVPDLIFGGTHSPPLEVDPVLTIWYGREPGAGRYQVAYVFPTVLSSDVVPVTLPGETTPGLLLADSNGAYVHYLRQTADNLEFQLRAEITGFASLSPNRGMAEAVADVNGDGWPDLVTKQKLGDVADANQIEITVFARDGTWSFVGSSSIDTSGFRNDPSNEILRPHNLAVGDLMGSTLPEIVAGFAARRPPGADFYSLDVGVWQNGCTGDVNRDGVTDQADLRALLAAMPSCRGDSDFNPDADVDKNGCVTGEDLALLTQDLGCRSAGCPGGQGVGDMNCDCAVNLDDVNPFVLALLGPEAYYSEYHDCNWLNADVSGDGQVDLADINAFVQMLGEVPPG